jgi:hypothetical protein
MGSAGRKRRAVILLGLVGVIVVAAWRLWHRNAAGDSHRETGIEDAAGGGGQTAGDRAGRAARGRPSAGPPQGGTARVGSAPGFEDFVLPPGPYRPPRPDDCDDGDPCTRDDRFGPGGCRGEAFTCDDGNPETTDECTGRGCLFRPAAGVTRPAIE